VHSHRKKPAFILLLNIFSFFPFFNTANNNAAASNLINLQYELCRTQKRIKNDAVALNMRFYASEETINQVLRMTELKYEDFSTGNQ
jgi:hypothetical protein